MHTDENSKNGPDRSETGSCPAQLSGRPTPSAIRTPCAGRVSNSFIRISLLFVLSGALFAETSGQLRVDDRELDSLVVSSTIEQIESLISLANSDAAGSIRRQLTLLRDQLTYIATVNPSVLRDISEGMQKQHGRYTPDFAGNPSASVFLASTQLARSGDYRRAVETFYRARCLSAIFRDRLRDRAFHAYALTASLATISPDSALGRITEFERDQRTLLGHAFRDTLVLLYSSLKDSVRKLERWNVIHLRRATDPRWRVRIGGVYLTSPFENEYDDWVLPYTGRFASYYNGLLDLHPRPRVSIEQRFGVTFGVARQITRSVSLDIQLMWSQRYEKYHTVDRDGDFLFPIVPVSWRRVTLLASGRNFFFGGESTRPFVFAGLGVAWFRLEDLIPQDVDPIVPRPTDASTYATRSSYEEFIPLVQAGIGVDVSKYILGGEVVLSTIQNLKNSRFGSRLKGFIGMNLTFALDWIWTNDTSQ